MTVKEINAVMYDMCYKAPVVLNTGDAFDIIHGRKFQKFSILKRHFSNTEN